MQQRWYGFFSGDVANFVLRCVLNVLGICLVACGIALSKLSTTGTSAISCVPAVLSDIAAMMGHPELTLGVITFAFNAVLILAEVLMLRRRFSPVQLLQFPLLFVFSWAIDAWMGLFSAIPVPNYGAQLAMLAASMLIIALGVFVEVKGNVLMLPGEAVVYVISHVSGAPFHRCKVAFDTTCIATAAIVSLLVMHGLFDVREGSILAAVLVGNFVKMWLRLFGGLDAVVPPAGKSYISPLI